MKLIIDIDEKDFYRICQEYISFSDTLEGRDLSAIAEGTPIPNNDCNSCEKAWTDKCERAECYENNYKHWTPYQKGSK